VLVADSDRPTPLRLEEVFRLLAVHFTRTKGIREPWIDVFKVEDGEVEVSYFDKWGHTRRSCWYTVQEFDALIERLAAEEAAGG
jgi:hypothetical protein